MKLYYTKGACSLAVRIIINELGLPSEYESVDLKTKQTATGQDFLSINPKGAVPVLLTDDNEFLTENAVIQQYLAEKYHAPQLLPPVGDFKRYRVLEWQNYITTELHKGFSPLFNPIVPQDIKEQIFIPLVKTKLNYVDKHLHPNKYLAGENFTLPDAYLFVIIRWALYYKFDMDKWPYLSRYHAELKERKSIKQSLEEEHIT